MAVQQYFFRTGKSRFLLWAAIWCGIGALVTQCWVTISDPSIRSPIAIELSRGKELGRYLREYAEDHEGKFPATISEIMVGGSNDVPGHESRDWVLNFHDPTTHQQLDWIYFPGRTLQDGTDKLLFASPWVTLQGTKTRVEVYVDGSAHVVKGK